MRRRELRDLGFTLVEMLVVVVIIGILSALAAPQVSQAMANRRMHQAAVETQSFYRQARARAMARGVAQLVRYVQVPPSGRLEHWEGYTNGCATTDWVMATNSRGAAPRWQDMLVDEIDFARADSEYTASGIRLDRFSTVGDAGDAGVALGDLCFTPLGRVFFRTDPALPFVDTPPGGGNGGYQLRIRRWDGADWAGVPRYVVIPYAGTPRLQVARVP